MSPKFLKALAYVFDNEGGYSSHPLDKGGRTRYGITEATAKRHGFDVKTITKQQAAMIYNKDYWRFEGITDDCLAIKVFDFATNAGVGAATKLLQEAANELGTCLEVDGALGPKTIAAANNLDADKLIIAFAKKQEEFYEEIVRRNPPQKVFLKGWKVRAARVPYESTGEVSA